jgi:phosphoribosyl 1,2-cyclic phosphodiesterase
METTCMPCAASSAMKEDAVQNDVRDFDVLFLGTGVSTAIPCLGHVMDTENPCAVCTHALSVPGSRNRRNNVSIAITFRDTSSSSPFSTAKEGEGEEGTRRCVLVDAGKTMRDACVQWFPTHGIRDVHALLVTHGHADAILGLDDVRDLQRCRRVAVPDPHYPLEARTVLGFQVLSGPLPVFATATTWQTLRSTFPYLTSSAPPPYLDEAQCILERRVALLATQEVDEWASLEVHGLPVQCFPVFHGGQYVSLGFSFGAPGEFVYISDVKVMPEQTWRYLKSLPRIRVLVVDALDREGIWSHCGLSEALDIVEALDPLSVYLTGISCGLGLHDQVEEELQQRCARYHLAFDGLTLRGFHR